jgi:hypothetical protein
MSRVRCVLLLCLATAVPAAAQISRVSVSTAGAEANGPSTGAAVSATGRFVAFDSGASNLVSDDTNNAYDVFLRDRDVDEDGVFDEPGAVATIRASVGAGAVQANGTSRFPAITPDGRFVFFVSNATNLVAGGGSGSYDIYRLDRTAGAVIRVLAAVSPYATPVVSDDGNVAVTLAGGPLWIVARDIAAGQAVILPPPYPFESLVPSAHFEYEAPSISADGTLIGYGSYIYYTRAAYHEDPRFHVYERATRTTAQIASGNIIRPSLVAAGTAAILPRDSGPVRRVLATGAEEPMCTLAEPYFVRAASPTGRYLLSVGGLLCDAALRTTTSIGVQPQDVDFSHDGRFMAVSTETSTLLPGNADTNGVHDVFVFDLPDFFDADDDTMDDRWETLFGVTDPTADPDGDGQTNAQEEDAGTHPNGQIRRFLAEGATGAFFHTEIALANPGPAATVVLTFDRGDGTRTRRPIAIPAGRSAVIDVGAVSGFESADVSATVESDRLLAVQRSMSWGSPGGVVYGSHAETATPSPSPTWYLTEGSTVLGFELFYLLQNPQPSVTHATVRFLLPSGTTITRTYDLPPASRTTIYVNQVAGLDETDVSGDITADAPIVVERSMYRSLPGQPFALGTDSIGVPAANTSWFLAEGATGTFFDLYVLIANPGNTDATVLAQYAKPDGSVVTQTYTVRAHSRFSVYVDGIPGLENTSVATTLTSISPVPIVAERAMYWPGGFFDYYEGHTSAGSTTTALQWLVAGAESGGPDAAQTFVLIANTENRTGQATIRLLPDIASGAPPPADLPLSLPPNSRTTVPLSIDGRYGVRVTSSGAAPVQIVVESAVYRSAGGVLWSAGSNSLATPVVP